MSDVAEMEWKTEAKRKVMRDNALKLYGL